MTALAGRLSLQWERIYPIAFGLGGAVVGYLWGPQALHEILAWQGAIENIYVATFTLGTVAAGFGLSIYTFLLTTESGFIGRAKKSIYYRQMLTYVLVATGLSGVLSLMSIPGMIIRQEPHHLSFHALYVALWAGILVWAAAALFRAAYLFSIFAREHH